MDNMTHLFFINSIGSTERTCEVIFKSISGSLKLGMLKSSMLAGSNQFLKFSSVLIRTCGPIKLGTAVLLKLRTAVPNQFYRKLRTAVPNRFYRKN